MDAFVGSVFAFGFNFTPYGWLPCNGQTVPIASYEALYALVGTTYGGNGTSTFGLPNLNCKVPVGVGQGPGLSNVVLGQTAGAETVTLTPMNMPTHTHAGTATLPVNAGAGTTPNPQNGYFATDGGNMNTGYYQTTGGSAMLVSTGTSSVNGGSNPPLQVMNPYQTVNYCICYVGIFPTHP